MKTKLILKRFGGTFGTLDEKSSFINLLGFTPYWVHRPTHAIHADGPSVYTSDEFLNLSATNEIHLKSGVIDGSVVKRKGESIVFGFILDQPAGYKKFREPEAIYHKRMNKSL